MELHFFDQQTYHLRRKKLAESMGSGLIFLPGNEESGINYKDNTYPFRQDSSFLYYAGIDRAGLSLVIDCTTGESILIADELTVDDIVWTGPMPSLIQLAEHTGIDRIISVEKGIEFFHAAINKKIPVHYLPIYRGDQAFKISDYLHTTPQSIDNGYSETLAKAVVNQREIKSKEELKELEVAINYSGEMHYTLMTHAKIGMTEAQLMAKVRTTCLAHNVDIPYAIILSVNGQTLHNHSYDNTLRSGQLVLGDFGAESPMHYAGDITRTVPVDKKFTPLQKDIYNLVLNTLQTSIDSVKNGVAYKSIHLKAAKTIASGMKDLGFLNGDPEEIVGSGAHALFFPHGLGHPLGLDVHDMEGIGEQYTGYEPGMERSKEFGLKSLRLAKTLKTGMVLTVEPGIYFIPELISIWKAQNKFSDFINYAAIEKVLPFGGIRIEDNVSVRDHDSIILGNPIPKSVTEIEELRIYAYQ